MLYTEVVNKVTFLDKLNYLMEKRSINKNTLSQLSGIPYTTIDGLYKKGYENTKLSTIRKLARALDVSLDYLMIDNITDENYGKTVELSLEREERDHIKKYRTLDRYGKEAVDGILEIEYRRRKEQLMQEPKIITPPMHEMKAEEPVRIIWLPEPLQPAAAGYGQAADDETAEQVPVRYNETTRKADYIMRVSGDSMEPKIHDDDRILVRAQPSIEEGEIGVFIRDSECVIKVYRGDYLESLNPQYGNLPFRGFSECKGLVIGVLRPEWIIKK